MSTRGVTDSGGNTLYACEERGCLVRYGSRLGYFLETKDSKTLEEEILPHVMCPQDDYPMYLAQVLPERRSFRLWKCPECNTSLTNEDSSGAQGKSTGA